MIDDDKKIVAAVTLIIAKENGKEKILLIRRPMDSKDPWSGQLAFPGGHVEKRDKDLLDTAIRECREECGFSLQRKDLMRELAPAVAGKTTGRELWVQPLLFRLEKLPRVTPDPDEVAEYHWMALDDFRKWDLHEKRAMVPTMPKRKFAGLPVGKDFLWGFSYEVLKMMETESSAQEPDKGVLRKVNTRRRRS